MTVSIRASLMLSALAMAALTAAFVDAPDDAKPAADKPHDQETAQAQGPMMAAAQSDTTDATAPALISGAAPLASAGQSPSAHQHLAAN